MKVSITMNPIIGNMIHHPLIIKPPGNISFSPFPASCTPPASIVLRLWELDRLEGRLPEYEVYGQKYANILSAASVITVMMFRFPLPRLNFCLE
jgi:hypothetical protein